MLWDPIRAEWVAATPEEGVRQEWIRKMIGPLGYPKGLLSVEKALRAGRRIDLLCRMPGGEGLLPLLLAECKAVEIDAHAEKQLLGYNEEVKAPFIALLGPNVAKTFWRTREGIDSVPFLPSYAQLIAKL